MFLKESRTENSIKNVKISTVIYFFSILLQFINRTFFLKFLSINYLGINGLFSNVLSLLNLTELGIGSAMAFALYEPCSCENQKLIKQIMYLYKKVYIVLGIIILIVGIIITPFLDFFIETPPQNIGNYHLYYVLYVINISISYFYTYKRSLIICYQKQYISSITTFLKNLFICIFQIITLYLTRSYVVYLIVQIIFTFLENIFISRIADKMYPFLEEKTTFPPKSIINNIKKNVLAMSFHKIGSVIVTGTDNLIITKFVSLSATGIYSNYLIIISSINSFLTQIFSSITASVGNLISEKDENKIYSVFKNILFLNFLLYLITSGGMFIIFNDFITIWLGEQYTFSLYIVFFICLNFFSAGMRKTILTFKDASGLFWNDRYKPIAEGIGNIVLSIPLTIYLGISGTFIGTIITNIFIASIIEGYVLYKYLFKKDIKKYFFDIFKYYVVYFIYFLILIIFNNIISFNALLNIFLKGICCILSFVLTILFFVRTEEYKYSKNLFKEKILKKAIRFVNLYKGVCK